MPKAKTDRSYIVCVNPQLEELSNHKLIPLGGVPLYVGEDGTLQPIWSADCGPSGSGEENCGSWKVSIFTTRGKARAAIARTLLYDQQRRTYTLWQLDTKPLASQKKWL